MVDTTIDQAPAEAIISQYEPLLAHCPKNIRILKTLAEAYASQQLFDKALACYKRVQAIHGGESADIKSAITQTTMARFDAAISRLDSGAPDYEAQRSRLENERREFEQSVMNWAAD